MFTFGILVANKNIMKIIRQKYLPVGARFGAINLFGVLFAKPGMKLTPEVLNHESIHTAQIRELWFIPFYILYFLEWVFRLFLNRLDRYKAYMNISFEREAYRHQADLNYLTHRKRFAMFRKPCIQTP